MALLCCCCCYCCGCCVFVRSLLLFFFFPFLFQAFDIVSLLLLFFVFPPLLLSPTVTTYRTSGMYRTCCSSVGTYCIVQVRPEGALPVPRGQAPGAHPGRRRGPAARLRRRRRPRDPDPAGAAPRPGGGEAAEPHRGGLPAARLAALASRRRHRGQVSSSFLPFPFSSCCFSVLFSLLLSVAVFSVVLFSVCVVKCLCGLFLLYVRLSGTRSV